MPQPSGDAPILATKLFVPPPREKLVARSRLRDRLAAARGGQVTLIAAAAGWGKSTLLADWAISAPGRVAWLSLDASEDDPRRLLNYVIAALRTAEAIASDELLDALSPAPEVIRIVATELLNAIALRGAPVALILDDYHTIESRPAHEAVQFLLDHLPPNLHVVIATRSDPPLALSRLRARGMLIELRGDDLRFTPDEARAFLNEAMGLTLDVSEVEELEKRTEGWVVGLQMAAISLSGRDGGARTFIQRFSGSNRYVLDYLTDEVLDRQSADVRRFLLSTSILTRLSPPLCDAVMQRGDSGAILEELDAANLFLIPLDDVRYWYRYHHLFATLLQHHLTRTISTDEIKELHLRASDWYARNRMPESALEHALAAGDTDRAIDIVSAHGLLGTLTGNMAMVVRWFDRLPQDRVESDINLLLARGMTLLADWQLPRAHDTVLKAAALLTEHSPPALRGAVLGLRGTLDRAVGRFDEGNENLRVALTLVDDESFWGMLARYQNAMLPLHYADAGGVIEALATCGVVRPNRANQVLVPMLAQTYRALGEWWRGNPERALALASEMFGWIDLTEELAPERPFDGLPSSVMAEVHCSWGQLEKAREYGDRALDRARHGFMLGLFESARACAHVALARKDWEHGLRAATDAQRAVRNGGPHFYWSYGADALIHAILFRRWQWEKNRADFRAVEKWMTANTVLERLTKWETRRTGGYYCDSPVLLASRVLIENEQYERAAAILDDVALHAVDTQRFLAEIEALIIRSILEARRGRATDAIAFMRRALDRASTPRYVQPFVDEGAEVAPIVERTEHEFGERVLASFDIAKPARPAVTEGLSEREREVLHLIASGASNQEAGRKLFIASSTVKKHLENIYAKLGVGGRVEAIARAKEMRIL
jgi:LuxR family maltose regulon positive regulatory protein